METNLVKVKLKDGAKVRDQHGVPYPEEKVFSVATSKFLRRRIKEGSLILQKKPKEEKEKGGK